MAPLYLALLIASSQLSQDADAVLAPAL